MSSVSGMMSTSLYFASVFLLMLVVMGPAVNLYRGSSLEAAGKLDRAVALQIDDLVPGMETELEFGSYPGMAVSVSFSGANVTATVNGLSATQAVAWQLEGCSLAPGEEYDLSLDAGVVTVE